MERRQYQEGVGGRVKERVISVQIDNQTENKRMFVHFFAFWMRMKTTTSTTAKKIVIHTLRIYCLPIHRTYSAKNEREWEGDKKNPLSSNVKHFYPFTWDWCVMRLTSEMRERNSNRKKSHRIVNGTCNKHHKLGNLALSLLNLWHQIHCM